MLKRLRVRVRLLLLLGLLPAEAPATTWGGPAQAANRCGACAQLTDGVEYEAVFAAGRRRSVFFHFACYHIWDQERTKEITTDNFSDV
ncbi:MAG TPA: hypothetical protein VFV05_07465 [Methylomirabilota bacterium]|nr:hypothetical protein [Methylomirabilota bacterium]